MSKLEGLLRIKRADVEARKAASGRLPGGKDVPSDDRRVRWDRNSAFRLIAEVKRASLSAGAIRPDLDLPGLVRAYENAGAAAISVLTEEHFFGGSLADLRTAASIAAVPVLQKDFILDPFQIAEAKQAGASFVLLIARLLSRQELASLLRFSEELQMNAIVEVINERDLEKIADRPVRFLGVNSRDLDTLEMDLTRFARLKPLLPADSFLIAESGIASVETLREVVSLGYHAALIGEHFLRSSDPASELASFVRAVRRPRVKICGITSGQDAMLAVREGADALGFVFADSPRRIQPATLKQFRHSVPPEVLCVGVFKGQKPLEIVRIASTCLLDVAQVYDQVQLPVPTWEARYFAPHELQEAEGLLPDHILWDVKLPPGRLVSAWAELGKRRVFAVAGGLDPGNVRTAIDLCRPQWIDVARGVEKAPGIKDEILLQQFMRNVL